MTAVPGDAAPDFSLPDQHGRLTSLAEAQGPTLLVFFPAAFTSTCTAELADLRDSPPAGATVLAISCDSMFALRAFAEAEGFPFPLLSDFWPHGAVSEAYGAFIPERGIAGRVSVLVDAAGVVRERWESSPTQARDAADYARAVADLG